MATDKADVWADAVVGTLVERKLLELAAASSRPLVASRVAALLARDAHDAAALAATLLQLDPVSELMCDDETLASIVAQCEPTKGDVAAALVAEARRDSAIPSAPEPRRETSKLDPELRVVLDRAHVRAARMGHREITLAHVLAEMLALPAMITLAKRRGGDPDGARAACEAELGLLRGGFGRPSSGASLASVLERAEETAPRLVSFADVALAALEVHGHGDALFRRAFLPARPAPAPLAAEEEDAPIPPAPTDARGPGALVISDELAEALRILHADAARHAESWTLLGGRTGTLSAAGVADAERELGTTLPDDFWAAAAARAPGIAALGVASGGGECTPEEETDVTESVLRSAEHEVDDDLVAIAELIGDRDAVLCVRRDVPFATRNEQKVFRFDADGRTELGTFGAFVLGAVRETHEGTRATVPPLVFRARLA